MHKTELGAAAGELKAICILSAPCDGVVTGYARFDSSIDGAKQTGAWLKGFINGTQFAYPTDGDFNNTSLKLNVPPMPVNQGSNITFETQRRNKSSKETHWEMWLKFTPS